MKSISIILSVLLLTACAGATYRPLVDRPGPDYETDLRDCQSYAAGEMSAQNAAIVGAIFGALLGAAAGHNTGYGNQFAGAGAVGGALGAGGSANKNQISIIQRCMAGRGYSVLR